MYENGGNTTHRFLDGHPQMFVYPFESQFGHSFLEIGFGDGLRLTTSWLKQRPDLHDIYSPHTSVGL